jgi:hypothetical protein
MGKLSVFDMAEKGVNVTKSPIHLEDGELTKAQNWQTDPTLADGAIRRRDSLVKLNSSALAGALRGLIALPYPDNFTVARTFYAPIDDVTTNTWRTSTTGAAASWATITTATLNKAQTAIHDPGAASAMSGGFRGVAHWLALNHKIYFPGDDYNTNSEVGADTLPTLYSWDGTTSTLLRRVPGDANLLTNIAKGISTIAPYSATEMLIATWGENSSTAKSHACLFLYSLVDGSLTQLGPETDLIHQLIRAIIVYNGRIWIAPEYYNVTGQTISIKWLRPGDAAWTTDANFEAIDVGGISLCEFLGDLYMGTHSSIAVVARIRKRTVGTGAWSTVKSTDGTGVGQYCGPLIKTADGLTLLAFYHTGNGTGPTDRILKSTDGSSWSTDLDIDADLGAGYAVSGVPFLDSDGSIYWPLRKSDNTGFIKKRTSAGVWSTVDTIANLRGPILPLKVVT